MHEASQADKVAQISQQSHRQTLPFLNQTHWTEYKPLSIILYRFRQWFLNGVLNKIAMIFFSQSTDRISPIFWQFHQFAQLFSLSENKSSVAEIVWLL